MDTQASATSGRAHPPLRREDFSGARLIVADLRVGYLLLSEARYRALARLFGIPREHASMATLIALLVLAEALHDKVEWALKAPGGPTLGDAALGAAAARELVNAIGGETNRDTPLYSTLVLVALFGALSRPALRASARGVRGSSHRLRMMFKHRYGHLIGPSGGRRRPAVERA